SMSPYMKEIQQQPAMLSHSIEAGNTGFFVPKGYVHVIAQIRGTGYSQGQYQLFHPKEHEDGYDLVEWMAQQHWCDGNVGMIGDSYFAMIQYLVAEQQPPHLKCIAPFDGATDLYRDIIYQGGMMQCWFMGMWGVDTTRQCYWPGPIDGKLPPANFIGDAAVHPEDGPYYRDRSALPHIDRINVPVLSMVPQLGLLHSRGQLYAYPLIKTPKKLLVVPPADHFAQVLFIESKPLNEHLLKWYDCWLKGKDTGILDEPEVAIFDNATREWRYEDAYPIARTQWTKFYMRASQGGPATEPPYGLLSEDSPGEEAPDHYMTPQCMPLVAAGKPVLAFSTPVLEKDVRVWGPLSAVLYGASTTLDTAWFVKIGDVDPDGNVNVFSNGHLKASFREVDESKSKPGQPFHPFQNPVRPEPGKIYEYQIEIMPIFHTFKAGHKIWVQIASDDFFYHYALHTIFTSEMLPVPAKNTVYHDKDHPSHLLLPIVPDAPEIRPVEPPVSEIQFQIPGGH
ncbi:MAG: CocE/NonD family hydrolase, partial [Deltaproteobacteria bacterium]|nr:CocE/NonD family hydrolase [Deltaproteobacteria bacterium]